MERIGDGMEYKLESSTTRDVNILVDYKLRNIFDYADRLRDDEMSRIIDYIKKVVPKYIDEYKNIVVDSKIIGCVNVKKEDSYVVLEDIYIEEPYRNKGIGTSIIKDLLKENEYVKLCVWKRNRRAYALYESLGFQVEFEKEERYHMVNKIEEKPKKKKAKPKKDK